MTAVVHLIDDDDDFRRSLSRLLGITGYRVASYESAAEFLHQYDRSQRGCILLDVAMEEPDGLMFQERLKQLNITMPVIFVSGTSDIRTSVRAMRAGAEDFLQKPVSRSDLVHAIDRALQRSKESLEHRTKLDELRQSFDLLTPREKEVFDLVVLGKLNKQVGYELGITVRTVKTHRQRITEKLRVRSVAELVMLSTRLDR
jgi:RNA polymerase sigma factor (sigma-70 family)